MGGVLTRPPPDNLVVSLRDELGRQTGADIPVFDAMGAIAISDPRFCRGDVANVRSLRVVGGRGRLLYSRCGVA